MSLPDLLKGCERGRSSHRSWNSTSKCAHLSVATIVDQDQQDVRRIFQSKRGGDFQLRLDRLRVLVGQPTLPLNGVSGRGSTLCAFAMPLIKTINGISSKVARTVIREFSSEILMVVPSSS